MFPTVRIFLFCDVGGGWVPPKPGLARWHFLTRLLLSGFCLTFTSSDNNSGCQTKPSMGQLALYLLALRANCEFVRGRKGDRLVSQLKWFLEEEKRAIGEGTPSSVGGKKLGELIR